ncbi:MAG: uncharacterized protein PWR29_89 [Methanolobus sp.]|jgi:hypothetical protein|nr:uncharacterized protein [Methanolobus sp.]
MIEVAVSARLNPTEDREIVRAAMKSMFPENEPAYEEVSEFSGIFSFKGDIHSLVNIHYMIRQEQIIDTARTQLYKGMSKNEKSTSFIISKQVATVGHLNFPAQEEPLGSIEISIRADSSEELLRFFDWLTPPTENGIPNFELDITSV